METAFIITTSVLTALVVGLTQAVKQLGVPKRYIPLVSVGFGVLGTLGLTFFEPIFTVIFMGVAIGLSACGLYDFGKKTILGK